MAGLIDSMNSSVENNISCAYVLGALRGLHHEWLEDSAEAFENMEAHIGRSMTQAEKDEFDALYALKPADIDLSAVEALAIVGPTIANALAGSVRFPAEEWLCEVEWILQAYQWPFPAIDSAAECRAALGLPNP